MEMSKSAFAEHIGVSPGRISQMIAEGIIGPEALVGIGRAAKINVDVAQAQIGERRHPGQALGNGLATRVRSEGPTDHPQGNPKSTKISLAEQIQAERLEQEKRKNRQAALDEALANRQLVSGDDFRRELGRVGQAIVSEFTGMAPDIANAIAAEFSLPQRDVLHLVKKIMTDKRRQAAERARETSQQLPETATAEVELA